MESVRCPEEALEHIAHRWPRPQARDYRSAVNNCKAAMAPLPYKSGRLIGGYMVFYSIGSATGAMASTEAYAKSGSIGVSVLGATFSGIALAVWIGSLF